ncbi:hypothetical protein [Methylocaldum sp.]|uniref:hypothetical protein n=1 Tax=Methylocaldum sp. TaxID=1969727 RepID=UPI002D4DC229|nr:hypothetical protein [Methylocaldum sp.]HYE38231.1 hypothetical protein [Methylocaldum sp.]
MPRELSDDELLKELGLSEGEDLRVNGETYTAGPAKRGEVQGGDLGVAPGVWVRPPAQDFRRELSDEEVRQFQNLVPEPHDPMQVEEIDADSAQGMLVDAMRAVPAGLGKAFAMTGDSLGLSNLNPVESWRRAQSAETELGNTGLGDTYRDLGLDYDPKTVAGKYAKTTAEFAPNALMPGGAVARTLSVVLPGLASEAAGQATEGTPLEPWARTGAAIVGGGLAGARGGGARVRNPQQALDESMRGQGLDPAGLSSAARQNAIRLIESGRTPDEVAAFVASSDTPVPVPMRRGDMTQNPTHQLEENMALRGAYGERPAAVMQGQVARQQQALRENVDVIADNLAGGKARELGAGATPAAERLTAMRDRGEQWVSASYKSAREADTGVALPADQAPVIGQRLHEGLMDFDLQGVPRVQRAVQRFDDTVNPVRVREVFDARAQLNQLTQSSDTVEAAAARAAKKALDGYIDEALESGLLQGDEASIAGWRGAIKNRRKLGELFEGDDLVETLTERVARGGERRALKVDPEEAGRAIFGKGAPHSRPNLNRDLQRLRVLLDSPEDWNALRGEHFKRLMRPGDGGVESGTRQLSGVKIQKAWEDFLRDDPNLARTLYTPAEQSQITNFVRIAARITSPVKGGDNSSNSAVAMLKLVPAALKNLPFIDSMIRGLTQQVKGSAVIRSIDAPPSKMKRPLRPLPAAGAAAISLRNDEEDR